MSRIGTIARRSFLIGSVAIAGGVAFGVYQLRKPAPNPLEPGAGEAALNPFVLIDADGVTLFAPRAEMGQGVQTTWAALIAEELDVELQDIRVLHGPAAKAYYNAAMLGDALPGKGYDTSDFQHNVGEVLGGLGKLLSLQVTGGSTSMKDGFVRMREAGASARETLKEAAARRLGVARSALRSERGRVIAPDGTELSYSELAPDAAAIAPVQAALRDPRDWRLIGKSQPRVDMHAKVTGGAQFGIDTRLPGMRFAALRMNPYAGSTMRGFDAAVAETMPGIERIVDMGNGVAVVGRNTWLAQQAVEAIDIDWGDAPSDSDTEALFERIAASLEGRANSAMRDDGDADTLPEGATEVTAEYKAPYLAHATMEPMNATALFTGDALSLWCGNQSPIIHRDKCAAEAGLAPEAVAVHTPFMGGGFGRRAEFDAAVYATRVAKAMPGVPVQLTWSREEDMRHDFYRPGAVARYRGAVRDGRAVLLDARIAAQSPVHQIMERVTGFPGAGPDKVLVDGAFNQPYAIPNQRVRGYVAQLDIPVGFWRSVGCSHNGFFHETFIDEMAHAAGRDPLEFRIEMVREEHAASAGVLEAVGRMCGWTGRTSEGVGRGVAFTYSFGTPVAQVVEVADEGGAIRIRKAWIACDTGLALDRAIIEAQMSGGMIFGLSAAMQEITFSDGGVEQGNFTDFDALRMHSAPEIEVAVLESGDRLGGVGEPGTPPALPALVNALFDLTGKRVRELPFTRHFDLVI